MVRKPIAFIWRHRASTLAHLRDCVPDAHTHGCTEHVIITFCLNTLIRCLGQSFLSEQSPTFSIATLFHLRNDPFPETSLTQSAHRDRSKLRNSPQSCCVPVPPNNADRRTRKRSQHEVLIRPLHRP